MITPKGNDEFEIHPEATAIHGWSKEKLLELPIAQRPTIKDAWIDFISWAKKTTMLPKKPLVLCAYNGFGFDFRILIDNLSYFDFEIKNNILLIDPWLDMIILEKNNLKLDVVHKIIQS